MTKRTENFHNGTKSDLEGAGKRRGDALTIGAGTAAQRGNRAGSAEG
ncbi:hypothetical protein KCP73_01530 [Salmonella enterica subsp. enterica]|nr:hypothetical protein KCP73_01530 [Salmonella enterica subsp. enterica]